MDLSPLHSGPHNSVSDLTASDYILIVVGVLALLGIGVAIWHVLKRRQDDE